MLTDHIYQCRLSSRAVPPDNRKISFDYKIISNALILYNDSMCSSHIRLLSYIQAGYRNKFFHAVDNLVCIQNVDVKGTSPEIHQMPQINGKVIGFRQL